MWEATETGRPQSFWKGQTGPHQEICLQLYESCAWQGNSSF